MTSPAAATLPVIKALLDEATRKRFTGGVLGVMAKPEWSDATEFDHNGVAVQVVSCPSTLAVREALTARTPDRWLVVITDRDDKELSCHIRDGRYSAITGNAIRIARRRMSVTTNGSTP